MVCSMLSAVVSCVSWLCADGIVVCEKPFTPTSKEADELNAIAKKNNKFLAVYQSMYLQLYYWYSLDETDR